MSSANFDLPTPVPAINAMFWESLLLFTLEHT